MNAALTLYPEGMQRPGRMRPEDAPPGLGALGIGSIRAQTESKLADLNALRSGHFHGQIYPSGVMLKQALGLPKPAPTVTERGAIQAFSDKAARRLREAFLTLHVPGNDLWAVTLTTHAKFNPAEWRAIMQRFRMAVKRAGWAGLWRVELQKRKTPHAHVAFWVPVGLTLARIADLWLDATGEGSDYEAVCHAVHGHKIPHDESGWAVYLALHDGKHKEDQLGWLGKQWGVWNRQAFKNREPDRFELTPRQHAKFLRVLAHLDRSKREAMMRGIREAEERRLPPGRVVLEMKPFVLADGSTSLVCCVRSASEAVPVKAAIASKSIKLEVDGTCAGAVATLSYGEFKRPLVKKVHRGNLLRCVPGAEVRRIVDGLHSGRIY